MAPSLDMSSKRIPAASIESAFTHKQARSLTLDMSSKRISAASNVSVFKHKHGKRARGDDKGNIELK